MKSKLNDETSSSPRAIGATIASTLPALAGLTDDPDARAGLLAGLAFTEGVAADWTALELVEWFRLHLEVPGRMKVPSAVSDPVVGTVALSRTAPLAPAARGKRFARSEDMPRLLAMARSRVLATLRGFIATPPDDRFLQAAIFAQRVRRESKDGIALWSAHPEGTDLLSNIVLSLFAADVLNHREFYEASLCVCDVCGRVWFTTASVTRTGCVDHVPRTDTKSGFQTKG